VQVSADSLAAYEDQPSLLHASVRIVQALKPTAPKKIKAEASSSASPLSSQATNVEQLDMKTPGHHNRLGTKEWHHTDDKLVMVTGARRRRASSATGIQAPDELRSAAACSIAHPKSRGKV